MVSAQSNVIDKIVARVGNEYILKSEIENMYMQENSGSTTSNADIRAELLEQLLIQKLLCTEAHLDSIDVNVTDVHVQQAIEQRINQMIETIGSKERLEQYFGQTIQELSEDMFPSYHSMLVAEEMLIDATINDCIAKYAENAKEAGLDGVVCSPLEASLVKEHCGKEFFTITPGVRFADSSKDDQVRIMTPAQAREIGSDYIVVGRPITAAENPVEAYERCCKEFLNE